MVHIVSPPAPPPDGPQGRYAPVRGPTPCARRAVWGRGAPAPPPPPRGDCRGDGVWARRRGDHPVGTVASGVGGGHGYCCETEPRRGLGGGRRMAAGSDGLAAPRTGLELAEEVIRYPSCAWRSSKSVAPPWPPGHSSTSEPGQPGGVGAGIGGGGGGGMGGVRERRRCSSGLAGAWRGWLWGWPCSAPGGHC